VFGCGYKLKKKHTLSPNDVHHLGFFRVAAGGDLEAVGGVGVGLETGGGWGLE
jgi:hypothetical protein